MVWLQLTQLFDNRISLSTDSLQSAIAEAVRKSDPACQGFVGVIIKRETPKSRFGANWGIRGVKFGSADREKSNKAIAAIVECMQREFRLSQSSGE
jgi:hypothetical protein